MVRYIDLKWSYLSKTYVSLTFPVQEPNFNINHGSFGVETLIMSRQIGKYLSTRSVDKYHIYV